MTQIEYFFQLLACFTETLGRCFLENEATLSTKGLARHRTFRVLTRTRVSVSVIEPPPLANLHLITSSIVRRRVGFGIMSKNCLFQLATCPLPNQTSWAVSHVQQCEQILKCGGKCSELARLTSERDFYWLIRGHSIKMWILKIVH